MIGRERERERERNGRGRFPPGPRFGNGGSFSQTGHYGPAGGGGGGAPGRYGAMAAAGVGGFRGGRERCVVGVTSMYTRRFLAGKGFWTSLERGVEDLIRRDDRRFVWMDGDAWCAFWRACGSRLMRSMSWTVTCGRSPPRAERRGGFGSSYGSRARSPPRRRLPSPPRNRRPRQESDKCEWVGAYEKVIALAVCDGGGFGRSNGGLSPLFLFELCLMSNSRSRSPARRRRSPSPRRRSFGSRRR